MSKIINSIFTFLYSTYNSLRIYDLRKLFFIKVASARSSLSHLNFDCDNYSFMVGWLSCMLSLSKQRSDSSSDRAEATSFSTVASARSSLSHLQFLPEIG